MMVNFKDETAAKLRRIGKELADIAWIGGADCTINKMQFWQLADVKYDNGFGSAQIATDLKIVFKDGTWLDRGEYDGQEWWRYHTTPPKPEVELPRLVAICATQTIGHYSWESLLELNTPND